MAYITRMNKNHQKWKKHKRKLLPFDRKNVTVGDQHDDINYALFLTDFYVALNYEDYDMGICLKVLGSNMLTLYEQQEKKKKKGIKS